MSGSMFFASESSLHSNARNTELFLYRCVWVCVCARVTIWEGGWWCGARELKSTHHWLVGLGRPPVLSNFEKRLALPLLLLAPCPRPPYSVLSIARPRMVVHRRTHRCILFGVVSLTQQHLCHPRLPSYRFGRVLILVGQMYPKDDDTPCHSNSSIRFVIHIDSAIPCRLIITHEHSPTTHDHSAIAFGFYYKHRIK